MAIDPISWPETAAELIASLGGVSPARVLLKPPPGTATENDVIVARRSSRRSLCELIDGVLVEKAVDTRGALLGGILVHLLWGFLEEHKLGKALPGDAWLLLTPGLVRVPGMAFISWRRMPDGKFPKTPIPALVPDLAVEILSEGNTTKEIDRKLRDYFFAGTTLVWVINPDKETAVIYRTPDKYRRIGKNGILDGEEVLPGFRLLLRELFARADEKAPRA
jgi:Uma2 family endonuclease